MRFSAWEELEITRPLENPILSVRQTPHRLDIHKSSFYNWLKRYQDDGVEGLNDKKRIPGIAWNKIPESHREMVIALALDKPELSPREIAFSYTDEYAYHVSESTVYRLIKAQDLLTGPAYILMSAANKLQHPGRQANDLSQTDFTISRSLAGTGIIYTRCWTITLVLSLPGVYAHS